MDVVLDRPLFYKKDILKLKAFVNESKGTLNNTLLVMEKGQQG